MLPSVPSGEEGREEVELFRYTVVPPFPLPFPSMVVPFVDELVVVFIQLLLFPRTKRVRNSPPNNHSSAAALVFWVRVMVSTGPERPPKTGGCHSPAPTVETSHMATLPLYAACWSLTGALKSPPAHTFLFFGSQYKVRTGPSRPFSRGDSVAVVEVYAAMFANVVGDVSLLAINVVKFPAR